MLAESCSQEDRPPASMYRICLLYSNAKYLFEEIEESLAFLLLLLLLLLDNTLRLWSLYSYPYPNGVCIGGDYE